MTTGDKIKKSVIYILLVLLAAACLFPFLLMMVNATRDGVEITHSFTLIPSTHLKENWETVFSFFNLFRGMANSLLVAVPATLLTAYFSAMTAYGNVSIPRQQADLYGDPCVYDDSGTAQPDRFLQFMYQIKTGKFLYPADCAGGCGTRNGVFLKTVHFISNAAGTGGGSQNRRCKRIIFLPQDCASDYVSWYCDDGDHGIYRKLEQLSASDDYLKQK
jgi:hypothetical protein